MHGLLSMCRNINMSLLWKNSPRTIVIILVFLAFFPLYAEEDSLGQRDINPGRQELMSMELGDTDVSLQISGYWRGTLNAGLGMTFSSFGNNFELDDTPLFMQEADLTLSLWIRERWFLETSFQDDYRLNTYRAGYQGFPGEMVQYAGIGNTGLDFPSFPYLDLGEANPSSFGFYGRFGGGDLELHSLVRYDSALREERVFTNGHERNYNFYDINSPLRGVSFVLPDLNLSSVPIVYIETRNGPLVDPTGRRWRMLEASEYAASAAYGIIELSLGAYTDGLIEPDGLIAVSYNIAGDQSPWNSSLGSYGSSGAPGAGFLGDAQAYFDSSGMTIDLSNYPQAGGAYTPVPGQTTISGVPVLIIYEKGTFSPYERQNHYQMPSGGILNLVRLSAGTVIQGYELLPAEDYIRMVVRLIRGNASTNSRAEKDRWPLVTGTQSWLSIPEIYLPGRHVFTGDLGIRITSLTAVDAYYIGIDVVPGSVQVFRDGLMDPDFTYNASNGTVLLRNAPFFNETIRITYLRSSEDRSAGSIAAGIGVLWNQSNNFNTKIGLGLRWNISDDTHTEPGVTNAGTIGIGAEANWIYDRLRASLTLGFGFEQPDSTGLFRAAGMENNEALLNLSPTGSFISSPPALTPLQPNNLAFHNRAPLVYRNYRDNSLFGSSSFNNITASAPIIANESGPYPAMDTAFVGTGIQVLVAEFTLDSNQSWTGFQVPLGPDGSLLERAKEIELQFRFLNISDPANLMTVIFQAGRLSEKDSFGNENEHTLMEWELYSSSNPISANDNSRRIEFINLSDDDRRSLQGANYIRILISASGLGANTVSGRVILAPPIIKGAGWRPITTDNNNITPAEISSVSNIVSALETIEFTSNRLDNSRYSDTIRRFHTQGRANRVLELKWDNLSASHGPGADHRLSNLPLTNYRSLSFFVRRPRPMVDTPANQAALNAARLRFFIGHGPQSLNNQSETIIDAEIPLQVLADRGIAPGEWAKVEIRYQGNNQGIYIDNNYITGSTLWSNTDLVDINSVYIAFLLIPVAPLPDGDIAFDEVLLEQTISSYRLNAGGNIDYRRPGTIVSAGNIPIIQNIHVTSSMESGVAGNPFEDNTHSSLGLNNRNRVSFALFGINTNLHYSFSLQSRSYTPDIAYSWRAGHAFSRGIGPVNIQESFDLDPRAGFFRHEASLMVRSPFSFMLHGDLNYRDLRYDRRWQSSVVYRMTELPFGFTMGVNAGWLEINKEPDNIYNYTGTWIGSFEPLMPNMGENALRRNSRLHFNTDLGTEPIGFRLYGEGNTSFYSIDKSTITGSLLRLDIPFVLEVNSRTYRLNFREQREYRRNVFFDGHDFNDDFQRFGDSTNDSLPLMFSVPFYSLFSPDLQNTMFYANSNMHPGTFLNSSIFSELFEVSLLMPENYLVSSLYIPSRISLRFNRLLNQRMDVLSDTLSIGTTLNFSSVNLFGAMGSVPVFPFYSFDQINHFLDFSVSMPRNERVTYRFQSGQELAFFGFEGAELSLSHLLTISSANFLTDENRITDSISLVWTSPMQSTLLGTIYSTIMNAAQTQNSWLTLAELGREDYDLFRRESLEFMYEYIPGQTTSSSMFSLILGHESIVRILGRMNLSAYARLRLSNDFTLNIFRIMATVGTSLSIMF